MTTEEIVVTTETPTPAPEAPAIDPCAPVFNEAAIKIKKYNSEFRIIETVLSLGQLSLSRKPEIRAGKAVMFIRSDSYNPDSALMFLTGPIRPAAESPLGLTGNCTSITKAGINRTLDIIEVKSQFTPAWMVGILHEPSLAKEPKYRKYAIESVLGQTIIELARLAPMNPTLRSHLTAIYHVPPPPEADTFQKLKDWMEFEFDPPHLDGIRRTYYGIVPAGTQRPGATLPPPDRRAAFDIKVTLKGKQLGTCRYIADANREAAGSITVGELTRWIRDGMTVGELVDNAVDRIRLNVEPNFEAAEVTNHVYSEHVFEDVEGIERIIDREEIEKRITDYLRRTYGTEEAQQIIDRR